MTKSISEKTEDSLVEKPDSPKAHLNNESLTLDNKSDSKEIKKTDETSVSQTEMIANDVTGENEMDVSEKCDEIDACQEAKAKTLEINEAIGNEEIHLEMTETDTVSDHEPGVYKVMVNENIQIVDSHEISKCKPLDDGQMSDYSNIDIDTKIMEGIELDKVSSIETIEKLADCETEANAETVESGQKVDDAGTEHNHGDEMDSGEEQLNENVETDKIVAALNTETDNILKGETGVDKNEKVETAAVNTETDKILTGESEVAEDVIGQVIEAGAISKTTEESDDIKDEIETTNDGKGECLAKQEGKQKYLISFWTLSTCKQSAKAQARPLMPQVMWRLA